MGCCKKFCIFSTALIAVLLGYSYHKLCEVQPLPKLDHNQWWGPGKPVQKPDTSIRPFKIEFKPERIADLKERLSSKDWYTDPLEGIGFQYGFNSKYLFEVLVYWKNKYDFAERENYLNKYPHFKTQIQGLDIHFIHIKQKTRENVRIIPLLLLHGWPGSFVEFHKIIPMLTAASPDRDFVFEIIVPSLPGYGYSQGASKPGLASTQIAVVMKNLMARLGYDKYMIQGGDWGGVITSAMATLFPEHIYGYHTNMPFIMSGIGTLKLLLGSLYPPMIIEKEHESKVYPLSKIFSGLIYESGYFHLQATKPDTIGIALKDSPIALVAYILEKMPTWTTPETIVLTDGGMTKRFTLTELLDNIMIYWDSRCITTAVRLYAESFSKAHLALRLDAIPIKVPTAVARFPHEILFHPRWQLIDKMPNLVRLSDFETGGHFAAFEQPKLLADDILASVADFDNFYKNKKEEL